MELPARGAPSLRGPMLAVLDKAVQKTAKLFLDISAFVAYPILICVVLSDIVLRAFFNSPLPWGNEVSGLLLIICFFGPVCTCEQEKNNIALDFLFSHFSHRAKWCVELTGSIAGAIWIGLLSWRNFIEVPQMMEYGETGVEFHYPLWPLRLFLALACLLLFLRLCLNSVNLVGKILRGK